MEWHCGWPAMPGLYIGAHGPTPDKVWLCEIAAVGDTAPILGGMFPLTRQVATLMQTRFYGPIPLVPREEPAHAAL